MHEYISHWVLQLFRRFRSFSLALLYYYAFLFFLFCWLFFFCQLSCRLHEATWSLYLWHSLTFVLVDVGERDVSERPERAPRLVTSALPPFAGHRCEIATDSHRFTNRYDKQPSSVFMHCTLLNVIRLCRAQLVQISDKNVLSFYGFHPLFKQQKQQRHMRNTH